MGRVAVRGARRQADDVPYRADGSGRASSTDPTSWSTFEAAVAGFEALSAAGVGYVFAPDDGLVGVDLDAMDSTAEAIIATLKTYTERSVSGRGAHLILRGRPNGHPRNRKGPLEVYAQGRYFVMTGDHVAGSPTTIEARQAELETILEQYLPAPETSEPVVPRQHPPVELNDHELIEKAMTASKGPDFAGLYAGSWEGRYDSQSEADLTLCNRLAFWTGCDRDRMDRLFRGSGLYREKWDERLGNWRPSKRRSPAAARPTTCRGRTPGLAACR